MRKLWEHIYDVKHFLWAVGVILFLLLFDVIGMIVWEHFILLNRRLFIEIIALFSLVYLLSFCRLRLVLVGFLFALSFIDIGHFYFFKGDILPYEWRLVLISGEDVWNALSHNLLYSSLFIGGWLLSVYLFYKVTLRSFFFMGLVGIVLLFSPLLLEQKMKTFLPSSKHLTIVNTLLSFERALYQYFHRDTNLHLYQPYQIIPKKEHQEVVILVMGESLNYKRMHLFGENCNNTPYLDKLLQSNQIIKRKAISGATETTTSIASFLYMKREADNIDVLQQPNLLSLAQQAGYDTYWLSMQLDNGGLLPSFVNQAKTHLTRVDFQRKYDDEILKKLTNLNISKKSFIIIHLMANHYYYETYTPSDFYKWDISDKTNYHKYMLNSYYNSVLYIDDVLSEIIKYSYKHFPHFSLYFTSDHGERLGFPDEKGKYLHLDLDKAVSYVPFIYAGTTPKVLSESFYPHYEISKMVADDLGYGVLNPNETGDVYYLNAPQFDGSAGFLEYNLSKWND
jgi:glucan phosphoethanolaminetransferase (alkaline phosphatase superfamily)